VASGNQPSMSPCSRALEEDKGARRRPTLEALSERAPRVTQSFVFGCGMVSTQTSILLRSSQSAVNLDRSILRAGARDYIAGPRCDLVRGPANQGGCAPDGTAGTHQSMVRNRQTTFVHFGHFTSGIKRPMPPGQVTLRFFQLHVRPT
jgi:hypothetical protein